MTSTVHLRLHNLTTETKEFPVPWYSIYMGASKVCSSHVVRLDECCFGKAIEVVKRTPEEMSHVFFSLDYFPRMTAEEFESRKRELADSLPVLNPLS